MNKGMSDIDVIVSENLKKYYLMPNNIKDAEFAAVLNLSLSGARKIKAGESGLNMRKMDIIYKESGVTPNQLYFGDKDPGVIVKKTITIGDLLVSTEHYSPAERKNILLQYAELLLNVANNIKE